MSSPSLSVVVMVGSRRERCGHALAAILAQSVADRLEVLLLDFAGSDAAPVAGSDHPAVRVIVADTSIGYGGALATAVRAARAPVIAFVEEHVIVLGGWAEALLQAHTGPWAAVGAEVHPGDLGRRLALRIELISRNRWSAPAQGGETDVLRWQNVSYKKSWLDAYGERLPLLLASESSLFRQLRDDGGRLFLEPRARIVHAHEVAWGSFLAGTFHSARLSAAAESAVAGGALVARLRSAVVRMSGIVRWPWVLWQRTGSLPDASRWRRLYVANLPHIVVYYGVHAVAGTLGALAGEGNSERAFLEYELDSRRQTPDVLVRAEGRP